MGVSDNLKKAIFDVLQPSEKNGHYYALLLFSKTCDEILLTDATGLDIHKLGKEVRKRFRACYGHVAANKVEVDEQVIHVRWMWDDEFRELDTWKEMKSRVWILFDRELFDAIGFNKQLIVRTYDEKKVLGKLLHRIGIGADSIYWTENIKTE